MIKTATEMVMVERVDVDIRCDGLGMPPCSASLGYTLDGDESPRSAAREDGWFSAAGVDLCPSCRRQPHRHVYVEPKSGPRWDKGCLICHHHFDDHPAVS